MANIKTKQTFATAMLMFAVCGCAWLAGDAVAAPPPVDFDGDGYSDFAVIRNTGGGPTGTITWFILTAQEAGIAPPPKKMGPLRPVLDFDGDRISDFAVVRNTGGGPTGTITWFFLRSDELGVARPIFLQTSPTANHVRLVFTTQPSTNYALQTVNNPTQTTWATISNFVGNGKRMTNVVSTGTNRAMQFRIRAQ